MGGERNERWKLFVDEYLTNGMNAAQAYMKIFSTNNPNAAKASAAKLLKKPKVAELIKQHQEAMIAKYEWSKEQILNDLMRIKDMHIKKNPAASLKAIEIAVKMLGLNAPEQLELKGVQVLQLLPPRDEGEIDTQD
jgi:phage terminase small subunit